MLISIIIPTDGRRRRLLAAAIESGLAQRLPDGVACEVLVVDNTPKGCLRDVVAAYGNERLRWVHAATPGVAQARNVGVGAAKGTHVAFLDDDETAPPHWAGELLCHVREGAKAVFGPVEAELEGKGPYTDVAMRMFSRRLDAVDGGDISHLCASLGTGNSLFDKAACFGDEAEPFCTDLSELGGEDSVFLARLVDRGIGLTWAANAGVREHVLAARMTEEALTLRHLRNGQIRTLACFRRGGVQGKIEGIAWMAIGLAQALVYDAANLAFAFSKPERAVAARFKAHGGLGKVLWMRRFWGVSYPPAPPGESSPMPSNSCDSADPLLSIIVVSYRTREMTLECLRSIVRETKRASYEILVVDNASTDGSADAIAAEFPQVRLTALKDNVGFARGNNIAAKDARGKYLLLLNPDTVILDGAIDRLIEFAAERPEAGIWGGRTLYGDRSLNLTSCWQRMTLWNVFCRTFGLSALMPSSPLFNAEGYGGWDRSTVREVDIVTGCFLLLPRDLWQRLDGFDPKFFMYGEEADLCLRAARFGAHPAVTPDATIVHYGGASEQAETEKTIRLLAAKAELIQRHWNQPSKAVGLMLFALWPLTRAIGTGIGAAAGFANRARAETWWRVWQRRSAWRLGYR